MIEIPRAAVRAGDIAAQADFFSFGTNDLTQMTYGISRDDIGTFLPDYLEKGVFDVDPFESIDEPGVGALMELGIGLGRNVKPDLSIGICGEHGGDPTTIDFCYRAGLSYVSCSPFRVPLARLASAQAVLRNAEDASKKPAKAAKATAKAGAKKAADKKAPAKKPAEAKKAVAAKKPAKAAKVAKATAKAGAKKAADKKAPAAKKAVAVKKPAAAAKKAPAAKKADKKAPAAKKPVAKKPGKK